MPNPLLTEALKEAYASASVEFEVVNTLELTTATGAGITPLRVCQGFAQRTFLLEDASPAIFYPYPFELKLPGQASNGVQELEVSVSNVDGSVLGLLEAIRKLNTEILIKFRPYIAELTGPQTPRPIVLTVVGIVATLSSVVIKASVADLVNRPFPNDSYALQMYPGLRG